MVSKRLAVVRRSYRADGGAERIIARMLESLKGNRAIDITLVTGAWQCSADDPFKVLTCRQRGLFRHRRYLNFVSDVQNLLQEEHFDLVQSHERIPGCQIYRAGDGVHRQWLAIRQQLAGYVQKQIWKYSFYHNAVLEMEAALFSHPALKKVICNSVQIKQDILRHYPDVAGDKLVVIRNGIDLQDFSYADQARQKQARQKLGLREQDKILLYVGSGFQRKGVDTLLRALSMSGDWKLLLVGKDKRLASYRKLSRTLGIEQRTVFCGRQSEVKDYYAASDLLVHPALYDPAPNVVLEAMAIGRGVILSRNCGNHDLVEEGVNGFVCTAADAESLAMLLDHCNDKEQLVSLGKQARDTAQHFPVSAMTQAFVELYQSVLDS